VEKITILIERITENKIGKATFGIIAIVAPLYFLKTLYAVWFGPMEVFIGFQSESYTWIILSAANFSGFLTVVPARKKGRIMQIITALWTIELFMVYIATFIR